MYFGTPSRESHLGGKKKNQHLRLEQPHFPATHAACFIVRVQGAPQGKLARMWLSEKTGDYCAAPGRSAVTDSVSAVHRMGAVLGSLISLSEPQPDVSIQVSLFGRAHAMAVLDVVCHCMDI